MLRPRIGDAPSAQSPLLQAHPLHWSATHTTPPHPLPPHTHRFSAPTHRISTSYFIPACVLRRRLALLLACITVTSALPDMEVLKGSARELWPSNDPTPTPTPSPQPRRGPVVWMGGPDEFEAVTIDGLQLEPSPSPSPDSEDEWNRRELIGKKQRKNRRGLKSGKKSECGGEGKGKGKKPADNEGSACAPWECQNGQLIGNGFDYDEDVAKTKNSQTCKWWSVVKDGRGNNYASTEYGFENAEQK